MLTAVVEPCVEANTITAITWSRQDYRIVRFEVRDSTGDLVGKILCLYSVLQRLLTLQVTWSVYTQCAATVMLFIRYFPFHLLALTQNLILCPLLLFLCASMR